MLVSYNWLQTYFKEKLPEPEKLGEILTFSAFELESVEQKGSDTILDIKVLPDRAHYALCHRGIARDISAVLGLEIILPEVEKVSSVDNSGLTIKIEDEKDCPRYEGRLVKNVTVGPSPAWLVERLESIGQRSINNIVDIANYVMFDVGQPLHAFDAKKVSGGLSIRRTKKGEKITTLDNREVTLDESMLLVADDEGPLGIAGIKGGNRAGVSENTTELILESAHFEPSLLRRTANKIGIRTDAVKRFENEPSISNTETAMEQFSFLISQVCDGAVFGEVVDQYPKKAESRAISVDVKKITDLLSVNISETEIVEKLEKLNISVAKNGNLLELAIPSERLDLTIPENIVEEIGRLVGYDKVPSVIPPKSENKIEIPKNFYYEWKIREILQQEGFSEVMTSSFGEKGFEAIEKPLADDKSYARPDLKTNFAKSLISNSLNSPLFGTEITKMYEIGKAFTKNGEQPFLVIGVAGPKKKISGILDSAVKTLSERVGADFSGETKDGIFECNLDQIFSTLPEVSDWDVSMTKISEEKFKAFSVFPFIVRDIALFVPAQTTSEEVLNEILANLGNYVVKSGLFDRFEKEGKISYAFRLVFQSNDKTLTDEEVNTKMTSVYDAVAKKGWQVR